MTGIQQEKTERTETDGPPLSLLPPVKSESGSSASLVEHSLNRLLAALKAAQPCDRFQSFTLFANGTAHALYDGAVFDFATPEHAGKLVELVEGRLTTKNAQITKP